MFCKTLQLVSVLKEFSKITARFTAKLLFETRFDRYDSPERLVCSNLLALQQYKLTFPPVQL